MHISFVVAQNAHHSGDRWFPGEKTRRCERQMHSFAHAWPPGSNTSLLLFFFNVISVLRPTLFLFYLCSAPTVQTGPSFGPSSGRAHADTGQHHASSLALYQKQQAAGWSREGVHQLQPLFQTGEGTDFLMDLDVDCGWGILKLTLQLAHASLWAYCCFFIFLFTIYSPSSTSP